MYGGHGVCDLMRGRVCDHNHVCDRNLVCDHYLIWMCPPPFLNGPVDVGRSDVQMCPRRRYRRTFSTPTLMPAGSAYPLLHGHGLRSEHREDDGRVRCPTYQTGGSCEWGDRRVGMAKQEVGEG